MRHKDRIYGIFSDAIRRAVAEHGCPEASAVKPCADAFSNIWREAERHGAYALIDRMLYRFGRYRLGDCTQAELDQILQSLQSSITPSSRRMAHCSPPLHRAASLDLDAAKAEDEDSEP